MDWSVYESVCGTLIAVGGIGPTCVMRPLDKVHDILVDRGLSAAWFSLTTAGNVSVDCMVEFADTTNHV